jgi:hypothetical protein
MTYGSVYSGSASRTVTLTVGSTTAQFSGTLLTESELRAEDTFQHAGLMLAIASITDDDTLELALPWPGSNVTASAAWRIVRNAPSRLDQVEAASAMTQAYGFASLINGQTRQYTVESESNSPPGSPVTGRYYLAGASPSGWAIAVAAGDIVKKTGSGWATLTAEDGESVVILATGAIKVRKSGAWQLPPSTAVVSNGDKGDITVSGDGAVWTIDDGVVNTAKMGGDVTTAGKALLTAADAAGQRTALSIGSAASLASDTDATLAANSDARLATQKAVKTYVDQLLGAQDAMVFKGVINASTGPNYPAADAGWTYRITAAGKVGGASGVNVEVGDILICVTDGSASGNQATVGGNWVVVQTNIDGAVVGPASVTDGHFAQFDGATGKLIKGGIALDLDGTFAANSDTRVPSQRAVKTGLDGKASKAGDTFTGNVVAQGDGASITMIAVHYGSSFPNFSARRARGSLASPTAIQSGDVLGRFGATGYGATSMWAGSAAVLQMVATENWSDTNRGAQLEFHTVPNGTTQSLTLRLVIQHDGAVRPAGDATQDSGTASQRWRNEYAQQLRPGDGTVIWTSGAGSPEGVVSAPIGSLYTRTDGSTGTTLYVKQTGASNTGWTAFSTGGGGGGGIADAPSDGVAYVRLNAGWVSGDARYAALSHTHTASQISDSTPAGRALLTAADAAAQRAALSLGTAATLAADTDGTLASNSTTRVPTQSAVKTYVDQIIAAQDAMVFRGVVDASTNPNYPAADRGHTYRISVAGRIGGASGPNVEAGDIVICLTDGTAAGTQAAVGANWGIIQTNLDGAVIGPASATDGLPAAFDGTTGKLLRVLSAAQLTALVDVATTSAKGAVPQLPGNTTTFLRGDGTFAAPPGGGGSSVGIAGAVSSTANTTASATDANKAWALLTNDHTVTIPTAASVAAGTVFGPFKVVSAIIATIARSGSDTFRLNGGLGSPTSFTMAQGQECYLVSDGGSVWEVFNLSDTALIAEASFSAASSLTITLPRGFRRHRLHVRAILSASATFRLRTSINGGSTWNTGASDYRHDWLEKSNGSALTTGWATTDGIEVVPTVGSTNLKVLSDIDVFDALDAATRTYIRTRNIAYQSVANAAPVGFLTRGALRDADESNNAIQLFPNSGTVTGYYKLEGVR